MIDPHLIDLSGDLPKRGNALLAMCLLPFLGACSHINMKQVAYEVLRQEDCRRNQLEVFCSRNFASEYLEYERQRQEYLRSQKQGHWRLSSSTVTLNNLHR